MESQMWYFIGMQWFNCGGQSSFLMNSGTASARCSYAWLCWYEMWPHSAGICNCRLDWHMSHWTPGNIMIFHLIVVLDNDICFSATELNKSYWLGINVFMPEIISWSESKKNIIELNAYFLKYWQLNLGAFFITRYKVMVIVVIVPTPWTKIKCHHIPSTADNRVPSSEFTVQ
jgi:hypothetical protein